MALIGLLSNFWSNHFDVPSAPKNQRIHQEAAHRLLGAMLPETGLIRGKSISLTKLSYAAGYPPNSDTMTELIRVLDNQLKLITATEQDEVTDTGSNPTYQKGAIEIRYQLTHDSLIPAIRRWLSKHQEKTFSGRAKKELNERCIAWTEHRDARQLPSFFQWVQIGTLVRQRDRTLDEHQMMKIASGKHNQTIMMFCTVMTLSLFSWSYIRSHSDADRIVGQLTVATTEELPRMLGKIDSTPSIFIPKLQAKANDESESEHVRFLATLALPGPIDTDPDSVVNFLLRSELDLLEVVQKRCPDWVPELEPALIAVIDDPKKSSDTRLRAGLILAGNQRQNGDDAIEEVPLSIKSHLEFLADAIVVESLSNKLGYKSLLALTRPIRKALAPSLVSISWDSDQAERKSAAVSLIRDLNVDSPIDLVNVSLDLSHEDFKSTIERIELTSLAMDELEKKLSSNELPSRMPSRRKALAASVLAVIATSQEKAGADDDSKWINRIVDIIDNDKSSVGFSTVLHSLMPLGFARERIFDSAFELTADRRRFQLLLLGEAIKSNSDANNGFKNQCRIVARDRFQNDLDAGVFSSARWLLIRLGDTEWVEDHMAKQIQKAATSQFVSRSTPGYRINSQKMPMIRFPANTIAATSETDSALPLTFSEDLIPYELEISTDEVTVEQYLRFNPAYSHQPELTSMNPKIPAGVITWELAIDYCRWLTEQDGLAASDFPYERDADGASVLRDDFAELRGYRLPTAREWVAIWDADPARSACVMDDSLVNHYARLIPFSKSTAEAVGGEKPDCHGIFHLATNAEEWCSDRLNEYRAIRGIYYGWGLGQRDKIAAQHWVHGQLNYVRMGFRVARSTGQSAADSE